MRPGDVRHALLLQVGLVARGDGLVLWRAHNPTVLNVLHACRRRRASHRLLTVALNSTTTRSRIALTTTRMHGHLIATIRSSLLELIRVHLLHLNPLRLLVCEAMRLVPSSLDRQMMIVLSVMLGRASVVALGVGLARVGALLLDEDSFERGTCAAVGHHDLLRVVEDLWVVDPAGARVLLLCLCKLVLLLGHLLVGHVALSLVRDACRALTFVVDACSLDGGCHRTSLFRLALHGARAAFSLEGSRIRVSGRLVQAFKVVGGGLLA